MKENDTFMTFMVDVILYWDLKYGLRFLSMKRLSLLIMILLYGFSWSNIKSLMYVSYVLWH